MGNTKRLWRYMGTTLYWCGITALLAPIFGVPQLPGNPGIYTVQTFAGYMLLTTWASLSWVTGHTHASRLTMAFMGAGLTALITPGAVRTMVWAVSASEDTIAIFLHAMTLLIFVMPVAASIQEMWNDRRRERCEVGAGRGGDS